ncbi:LacI family DNA-binding transcriptional regulator [Paenibacillus sp. L3-i20]|uniref:LacI family DNA-binding transcriptional regulator n=1 Tax=Paenibacillus sp. L3-i20 TaxID=2905833 RepID=UPI001EDDED5D|nr:LacI family DNA-binding transcriptional regulator [Paenibacillus sp. L3-i20]GKU76390.1 LacI family transcriptional regulator [Paenibacillus sp. L3-i20]
MASIKDVAGLAGVSVATVSRVLNDKGYVGQSTRENVEKAIKQLNYKPNEVARSLFKKKSNTIGLIVPDIMNPFFTELARAVEDKATKSGYTIILCNSDGNIDKEKSYLDVLRQNYVNGIIVSSNTLTAAQVKELNIPVVSIDREISKGLPTIVAENNKGAIIATRFLQSKGCKKIGHIRGTHGVANAEERFNGYKEVVSGEPWYDDSFIVNGNFDMQSSIEATKELLTRHPDIDGIFAANDIMAIGAIKVAYQLGMKVPEELKIIGFDGITLSTVLTPELTTIVQPIYELGEKATTMLVHLMEQQPLEKTYYKLDVELIERNST